MQQKLEETEKVRHTTAAQIEQTVASREAAHEQLQSLEAEEQQVVHQSAVAAAQLLEVATADIYTP